MLARCSGRTGFRSTGSSQSFCDAGSGLYHTWTFFGSFLLSFPFPLLLPLLFPFFKPPMLPKC